MIVHGVQGKPVVTVVVKYNTGMEYQYYRSTFFYRTLVLTPDSEY